MSTVTVFGQGPLRLSGPATIVDAAGVSLSLAEGAFVTLCRCGQSSNKPFCDTTHRRTGWNEPAGADLARLPPGVTAG